MRQTRTDEAEDERREEPINEERAKGNEKKLMQPIRWTLHSSDTHWSNLICPQIFFFLKLNQRVFITVESSPLQHSPQSYFWNKWYQIGNKWSHFTPFAESFTSFAEQAAVAVSCQFPTQSERKNELFLAGPDSQEKTKWRAGDEGKREKIRWRKQETERMRDSEIESTAEEVREREG